MAAQSNGVRPRESCTLTGAPAPISEFSTDKCPPIAAQCSGVDSKCAGPQRALRSGFDRNKTPKAENDAKHLLFEFVRVRHE